MSLLQDYICGSVSQRSDDVDDSDRTLSVLDESEAQEIFEMIIN